MGIIIVLAAIALASTTRAEFYRYVDEHGNVIYTDDLSKVPENQRPKATMPEGSRESVLQRSLDADSRTEPEDAAVSKPESAEKSREHERIQLEALKKELREEFSSLVEENAKLRTEQKAAVTPDQRKAVNKKVVRFNARFQAYQEKEAAYKSRLEAYENILNAPELEKTD